MTFTKPQTNRKPDNHGTCPVTGLAILEKPEWTNVSFGRHYQVTVSVVGSRVLWVQPVGRVNAQHQVHALQLTAQVPNEAIAPGLSYIHIEDMAQVFGNSLKARRLYITEMQRRHRIAGLIFCNASNIYKMSIKLGMRLTTAAFPICIARDYNEAIVLALDILSHKTQPATPASPVAEQAKTTPHKEALVCEPRAVCPVTSLPMHARPEWTDITIDSNFSVSFSLIGKSILFTRLKGAIGKAASQQLFVVRKRILTESGLLNDTYAEIVDYERYEGYPSMEVRTALANFLRQEFKTGNLVGFWVFNTSKILKWMYNVAAKFYNDASSLYVVGNYEEAISQAVNLLEKTGAAIGQRQYKKWHRDDWRIDLDGYGDSFELIGDDIVHSMPRGILKEQHVADIFEVFETVLKETGLTDKGGYYHAFNMTNLTKINWRAIRKFIAAARTSLEKTPCRLSVAFGMNAFMANVLGFGRRFVSIPVATAHNLADALAIIEKDKISCVNTTPESNSGKGIEKQLEPYCNELLQVMGRINWDRKGVAWDQIVDVDDTHPFKPVIDALAIIKEDVDDLFRERKQSEERYRNILENIEDGYFEVDLNGNLTFFNDALCRIIGYRSDQLNGINYRAYMDDETARKVSQSYANIFATGQPIKGLEYSIRHNGKEVHIETSVSLILDRNGKAIGFRGILRDISERKQAELRINAYNQDLEIKVDERTRDLKRSEEKYRTILESIEDGYYEVDLSGNLTFFNDAVCRITGYDKHELMGLNNRTYTDARNARKLLLAYNRVYQTGIPTKRLEWQLLKKNGENGFMETSISLMTGRDDIPIGFRGILRDVTERKKLEYEIIEKSRLAEDASKAKSEFLANMSHEIRTPLNGIIGMAELALDNCLDDHQKHILQTIDTEAEALQDIINEVLDFSKIEAGKLQVEQIPFDLQHTIDDVANGFAYRAERKSLDFLSFLAPDIPSRVIGDPGRLRQILINLIGNALKFTHQGEVYVRGELTKDYGHKIGVRFSITDTGIGIPKDKQTAIFESFRQADGSTTRKYGGTGLGTTISKQLVELMGGQIGLTSREGKGSTFWFTMDFTKQPVSMAGPGIGHFELQGLKVLIVDDNRNNRFIQNEYLKHWGCRPAEACCGRQALSMLDHAIAANDPFALILTDFLMPEMNGFDLAEAIRSKDDMKGVPIIVLTSVGQRGDSGNCLKIGIDGYLTKPIKRNELRKTIQSVLGLSPSGDDRAGPKLITRHSIAELERQKIRILVVEDYPTNQRLIMRHLSKAGYDVTFADNGSQAVQAFQNQPLDLILMDIQMPVMDGYEATRRIRALEAATPVPTGHGQSSENGSRGRRIPIVAMTAYAFNDYQQKCFEIGMDDFISKPLRRNKLLAVVETWIGKSTHDENNVKSMRLIEPQPAEAPPPNAPARQPTDAPIERNVKSMGLMESQSTEVSHINAPARQPTDAPMDIETVVEDFEGDSDFFIEVLQEFIQNVESQIGVISRALADGDAKTIGKEAHSIKGGAGNLTAQALYTAARDLETLAKSGNLTGAEDVITRLDKAFRQLKNYAETLVTG